MKRYCIYESPIAKTRVVKLGWSWPAFIFIFPWLALKGLWFDFLLLIVSSISSGKLLAIAFNTFTPDEFFLLCLFFLVISFLISITAGAYGNRMIARQLFKRGYIRSGTYTAPSPEAALATHRRTKTSTSTNIPENASNISAGQSIYLNTSLAPPKSSYISFFTLLFIALLSIPFLANMTFLNTEVTSIQNKNYTAPIVRQSTPDRSTATIKKEQPITSINTDSSNAAAIHSSGDWEIDSNTLITRIKNGDIKPRKAISKMALSQSFSITSQDHNRKTLSKDKIDLIEKHNIWWILPPKHNDSLRKHAPKYFIRLKNPSSTYLRSIIVAYTIGSCDLFDKQEKTFFILDFSSFPLRPNEYAVYYAPLPFPHEEKNYNSSAYNISQCSVITSALADR